MLTVHKVGKVVHLFHPSRPRRYTFVVLGDAVRVTRSTSFPGDRWQTEMPRDTALDRYRYLRRLGYMTWEELGAFARKLEARLPGLTDPRAIEDTASALRAAKAQLKQ